MKNVDIKELVNTLKNNKVLVEFVKVDGTKRKMLCTQNTNMINKKSVPTGKVAKTPGVITVFDLEKNDWRSMRETSIKNWIVD